MRAKGAEVEITPGSLGAFEISREGVLAYSKFKTGRFPTDQEVDALAVE